MIIKQKKIGFSYLIGLSIVLIFSFCQSNPKDSTDNEIDANDSIDDNVKSELVNKPEQIEIDTLTVQNRQLADGEFHSLIKLNFAISTNKINDTSNIRLIDKICAISVIPDTSWTNKQQKEMGDDWNDVVSDHQYYEQLAIDTLKKLDIPTFFAPREKRYINFIKADKPNLTIDLTKMQDAWGLILFNGTDNPVLWSSTDIDDGLKEIFIICSQESNYQENVKLASEIFISKGKIPDCTLLKLVPENIDEFTVLYQTTSPDNKMQNRNFFYTITQSIFDKVIIEKNNDYYLASIQLASFADGEFGEGFIENLVKIIALDKNKFCESIKGKKYVNYNPIKYFAEQNNCKE